MKILHVVGARPNFMKAAPVMDALEEDGAEQVLVHTGQHYDENMSRIFFEELGMPRPDVNLGVGSGSHAFQTGEVMKRIEPVIQDEASDVVLVYGDVNSTVASALVATKLHIAVGHVEAGLRSFDRRMPEEINRMLTDQISDLLLTHSPEAEENLVNEGVDRDKIHLVGNVMIDTLVRLLPRARESNALADLGMDDGESYVLVTIHRPSNVDNRDRLVRILGALEQIGREHTVICPAHPRTTGRMEEFGVEVNDGLIRIIEPIGYLDFLCLQDKAAAVVTDSGGIQEETTYLGVPCFTIRPNTERPVTISEGTNRLMGDQIDALAEAVNEAVRNPPSDIEPPEFWDGRAAHRISDLLRSYYG